MSDRRRHRVGRRVRGPSRLTTRCAPSRCQRRMSMSGGSRRQRDSSSRSAVDVRQVPTAPQLGWWCAGSSAHEVAREWITRLHKSTSARAAHRTDAAGRTSEDQRHMTAVLAASALVKGLSRRSRRRSCRHTTWRVGLDLVSPAAIDSTAVHAVEPEAGEVVSRAVVTRLSEGLSAFSQVSGPSRRSCARDLRKSGQEIATGGAHGAWGPRAGPRPAGDVRARVMPTGLVEAVRPTGDRGAPPGGREQPGRNGQPPSALTMFMTVCICLPSRVA